LAIALGLGSAMSRVATEGASTAAASPVVSVVMAAYNADNFIAEAVESVLSQTCESLELVVVDDGSTDDTAEILDGFAESDPRIRILHQANSGMVAALNVGCRAARGDFIARLDADDVALPNRLEMQVAFLEENPDHGLVGGASIKVDEAGREVARVRYPTTDSDVRRSLPRACPFEHSAVTMRSRAFFRLGGYRPIFGSAADFDLWLRFSERYRLSNLEEPVVLYRLHPAQLSASAVRDLSIRAVAARRSFELRASGEPDPLERDSELTREALVKLRLGSAEIASEVALTTCWYAKTMARARYPRTADQLWAQALVAARGDGGSANLVREVLKRRAASSFEQHRFVAGAISLARATLADRFRRSPG
jgi:glycosyltransferase involved in cell wall biosynthesis